MTVSETIRKALIDAKTTSHDGTVVHASMNDVVRALTAALSDQADVPVEVRLQNNAIDEIVIKRADTVHIEQMSADGWFMGVSAADGSYWQFWFGAKNRKSHVEFRHTETTPPSSTAGESQGGSITNCFSTAAAASAIATLRSRSTWPHSMRVKVFFKCKLANNHGPYYRYFHRKSENRKSRFAIMASRAGNSASRGLFEKMENEDGRNESGSVCKAGRATLGLRDEGRLQGRSAGKLLSVLRDTGRSRKIHQMDGTKEALARPYRTSARRVLVGRLHLTPTARIRQRSAPSTAGEVG